ncbi:MAG: LPS-assembly protein LptD [Steroidobacteraceae bacterium]
MLPPRPLLLLCRPSRPGQTRTLALAVRLAFVALVPLAVVSLPRTVLADGLLCPSNPASSSGPLIRETVPSLNAGLETASDQATIGENGNVVLEGHVVVRQGDREVEANEAHYDRAANALTVKGAITYQDPLVRLSGNGGKYSPAAGAEVEAAQFELRKRYGRGSAALLDLTPRGILDLKGVTFTTCRKADESWLLRARTLELDTNRQVGVGHGARIDFKGIPILYLPWFSFPLSGERKSGFLFPSAGNSSESGIELQVPYYWNIAPNADLTFSPMYYSRRGIDLAGETRLLTDSQDGEVEWHFLPDDQRFDAEEDSLLATAGATGLPKNEIGSSDRSFVTFHDVVSLPDDVRMLVDAANVSDPLYFEDFGTGPATTSTAFLQRLAQVTYRDEYWNLGAAAQEYQPVAVELPIPAQYLPDEYRPYARAPWLWADGDFGWGPEQLFRYGFDSELVDFTRAVGITGWRLDVKPSFSIDYEDPGYFIRSSVAWRYTQYELDNVLPRADRSPSRTLPIASFDAGLKFDRLLGPQGDRTLTLEPRVLYLYVPYRNQDTLPLFDTALPDLNLVELFSTNRYVGADRVSDADQATFGVTSRLLNTTTGEQYLSATLGQTYYIETPRVQLPGEDLGDREESDLVGEVVVSAFKNWNVDTNLDWNPAQSQVERAFVQLQYKPEPDSVVNIAYRYQRDVVLPSALATPGEAPVSGEPVLSGEPLLPGGLPLPGEPFIPGAPSGAYAVDQSLDQADVSGAWPIGSHWHVLARFVYDLDAHSSLDRLAGFEYRACCWRIRVLARRYLINGTGQQDTAFLFQLQLSGLGGVGPATDAFLGTAIRGYSDTSSNH